MPSKLVGATSRRIRTTSTSFPCLSFRAPCHSPGCWLIRICTRTVLGLLYTPTSTTTITVVATMFGRRVWISPIRLAE